MPPKPQSVTECAGVAAGWSEGTGLDGPAVSLAFSSGLQFHQKKEHPDLGNLSQVLKPLLSGGAGTRSLVPIPGC